MATVQEKIELLHEKLAKVKAGGGEKRVEKQHAQGKMTARERLAKLFMIILSLNLINLLNIVVLTSVKTRKNYQARCSNWLWYYRRSFSYMHSHKTSL